MRPRRFHDKHRSWGYIRQRRAWSASIKAQDYTGSYGVGASSGLFSNFSDDFKPSSVQCQEVGYNASILCVLNTISQWAISQFVDEAQSSNQLIPNVYLAGGATPDQELYWQLQYIALNDSNVVSINAHPVLGWTGNDIVVIATGNSSYLP